MKWTRTSYRCETWGPYSVTGHDDDGVYFLAYHKQTALGRYATGAEAKSACERHRREK